MWFLMSRIARRQQPPARKMFRSRVTWVAVAPLGCPSVHSGCTEYQPIRKALARRQWAQQRNVTPTMPSVPNPWTSSSCATRWSGSTASTSRASSPFAIVESRSWSTWSWPRAFSGRTRWCSSTLRSTPVSHSPPWSRKDSFRRVTPESSSTQAPSQLLVDAVVNERLPDDSAFDAFVRHPLSVWIESPRLSAGGQLRVESGDPRRRCPAAGPPPLRRADVRDLQRGRLRAVDGARDTRAAIGHRRSPGPFSVARRRGECFESLVCGGRGGSRQAPPRGV